MPLVLSVEVCLSARLWRICRMKRDGQHVVLDTGEIHLQSQGLPCGTRYGTEEKINFYENVPRCFYGCCCLKPI